LFFSACIVIEFHIEFVFPTYSTPLPFVIEKKCLSLQPELINQHIMATPIRMAPVLYGEDAEYFYEQWVKMCETPLKRPISNDEKKEMLNFMKKYKVL
jgi:hypothetical protein